jgi:hypothetical protein
MVFLAAAEILTIFTGIILLIWRLQFIFPEFGFILLGPFDIELDHAVRL